MSNSTLKKLPKELTSYDFFKTFAVIFMLVDHIGYYFYPEENWFRILGRFCVPVWFFFIGYAKTREIPSSMWIGGGLLVVANVFAGLSIFPLNILFTMIFVRYCLDKVMSHVLKGTNELWALCVVLFFLTFPTSIVTEYGFQAILMAMFGYMVRFRQENEDIQKVFLPFSIFAALTYVAVQSFMFGLLGVEMIVLEVGVVLVMLALYFFKPATYPRLTKYTPIPIVYLLKICGRKTLEIYVIHLLLFKFLSVLYGRFEAFQWTWTILST
jgi:hypothetical protein